VCHSADVVSRRVRRRRQQFTVGGVVLLLLIIYFAFISGGSGKPPASSSSTTTSSQSSHATLADQHFPAHSPLNPDWKGSGHPVTFGFGGDVHFAGVVGEKLAQDPSTALGTTIPQLFAGTQMSMVNLETAVTDGTCPEPQNKQYIFDAPASALTALKSASITLATQANDHGFDCGPQGLSQNLTIANQDKYPIIGIGNTAAQAFTPYRVTIKGQRIAIITATQVIADNLVSTWTASATQPGVASAIDPTQLVREVQQVRRTADTVIVYVHWGTEAQSCPNPQQEPLAQQLVKAGADVVVGSDAHVLSGAGYLGSSYVAYGLGNFAFYDDAPPETDSGALIITAEGRHVTSAVFRPATILSGLPQPLTGQPATTAIQSWNSARSCTNLAVTPSTSVATMRGETTPFVAPPAPPTTTTTSSPTGNTGNTGSATTTTPTTAATTTSTRAGTHATTTTTTAPAAPTTTSPTDNAGG
jgi:hypothetical protein